MKTTARRLPAAPIALAAALLTAFLVLFAPLSASAHDSLLSSSPEADGTVETLPAELTLTFSAKLIDGEGATEVVVTDPSGASVTDGAATVNGAIVTQPLASDGTAAGIYHVIWKIVSSDGHPTSGEFDFTVSTATEPTAPPAIDPTATAEPSASAVPVETSEPSATPAPEEESPAGAWIWVLVIAGIAVIGIGAVTAYSIRRRGSSTGTPTDGSATGSDAPTER